MKNRKGQFNFMMGLLIFVMLVAVLIAMIPALNTLLGIAQQSDELNCAGYTASTAKLSYNSSLPTSSLACLGISLYLPYIVLFVLIVGAGKIFLSRTETLDEPVY